MTWCCNLVRRGDPDVAALFVETVMLTTLTVIAAILGAVQSPSSQQTPTAPSAATAAPETADRNGQDEADEMVCRRERVLGSNRPQRICMTRRQWAAERDAARETTRQMDRGMPEALPESGI